MHDHNVASAVEFFAPLFASASNVEA